MHIKKQDLYEPLRGSLGWCLGVTTSTRGGGHTTGAAILESVPGVDRKKAEKIFGVDDPMNPIKYEGKPEVLGDVQEGLGIPRTEVWDEETEAAFVSYGGVE